jgi:hypothetical protein
MAWGWPSWLKHVATPNVILTLNVKVVKTQVITFIFLWYSQYCVSFPMSTLIYMYCLYICTYYAKTNYAFRLHWQNCVQTCQAYNITHTFPTVIILLQNQKLTLLFEVERKHSHLALLKKRYEEAMYLSEQSRLLHREKEKLGSLMGKLWNY